MVLRVSEARGLVLGAGEQALDEVALGRDVTVDVDLVVGRQVRPACARGGRSG